MDILQNQTEETQSVASPTTKTRVYSTYGEFVTRTNKDENGVSATFAELNPNFESENKTNRACWNCSDCSDCYRCYRCSDCSDCYRCYRCSDCSGCYRCSDCSGCYRCSGCSGKKGEGGGIPPTPKIENIHSAVLQAVSVEGALNMATWHTCETTHCRAGWVVQLAGEDGKALESATSTAFAAMQIYKESSPIKVSPVQYYVSGDAAMADMKRCADEEKALEASS